MNGDQFETAMCACTECGESKPSADFRIPNPLPGGPTHWTRCPDCRQKVWFAPFLAYLMAHACPTCKAPAGEDCNAPRYARRPDRDHRQHALRVDAAIRHYNRDVGNAPWSEERDLDRCYSTIKGETG